MRARRRPPRPTDGDGQRFAPVPGAVAAVAVALATLVAALGTASPARADEPPEYRLKAAFVYNFAMFTEWPAEVGRTLTLCVVGRDPFGAEIDALAGKAVGARTVGVQRRPAYDAGAGCQVAYVAPSAIDGLPRIVETARVAPILVVADSPGAARAGAALNMVVVNHRIAFEANLQAARAARVNLSAKLLRLATEVIQ